MKFLSTFKPLAEQYSAFILDLWGVIHDGTALYPGVKDTLVWLKEHDKKVVFLSNAPRRVPKVTVVLDQLGITPDLYAAAFCSGEAGARALSRGESVSGSNYYYIGPEKDEDVLDGLNFSAVHSVSDSNFLLNVGFGSEGDSLRDYTEELKSAREKNIKMICLNPDLEVVKITGERFECAGVIARQYEQMGGEVEYFGKPYPGVYKETMQLLAPYTKDQVLAVGDGLHTDILGANRAGIASAFASGGILTRQLEVLSEENIRAHIDTQEAKPDYVLKGIAF